VPKSSPVPGRTSSPETERQQRERGASGASTESVPRKTRRRFSASEKLRLVNAADAAVASGVRGALEALLRKEGIYSSHLTTWRRQLAANGAAGLEARKPGRKPKLDPKDRALLASQKEVAALKRKLEVANALIELQKKAHAVLGLALPELDEQS
jgi:transposase